MMHELLSFPGATDASGKTPFARDHDRIASAIIGLDGTIRNVNSVLTDILGCTRGELAGANWHDVLHPANDDGEAALFVDLLACAEESGRLMRRLVARNGSICRGELGLTVLTDEAGEPSAILAEFLPEYATELASCPGPGALASDQRPTTTSIAALSRCIAQGRHGGKPPCPAGPGSRKAADRTRGRVAGARHTGEPIGELIALMNHEFRTPLNAIIGFAQMLDGEMLGSVGDARYRQYARHIQESGIRLLTFVTDMLDLISYEHGGVQLHDEVVDPVDPVSTCLAKARSDCRSARLILSTRVTVEGSRLLADGAAGSRVLSFLVTNAIDDCGEGGRVTIVADSSGDGLIYAVEEVRAAASAAASPRGRTPAPGGHRPGGLGMPLCNWLMRLHGGSLAVENRSNNSRAVIVRFPESRLLRATKPRDGQAPA